MKILTGILFITLLIAPGCGSEPEKIPSKVPKVSKNSVSVPKTDAEKIKELRKKANIAEAASIIGYDGKAIKRDLNKLIDKHEDNIGKFNELDDF